MCNISHELAAGQGLGHELLSLFIRSALKSLSTLDPGSLPNLSDWVPLRPSRPSRTEE
jgi:hypothetical protein